MSAMRLHRRRALQLAGAAALAPRAALALDYPARPVKIIVPFAPGGPSDLIARVIATALQDKWGQPVVVENRAGAGGNIGTAFAARAEPDGYTTLVSTSSYVVNTITYGNPGYSLAGFRAIAILGTAPQVLFAAPGLKYNNLKDILAAAKSEQFTYASTGVGTSTHLLGELIFRLLGKVNVTHVPYNGGGPALLAAMGGQVSMAIVSLSAVIDHIRSGAIKPLGITAAARAPELPDVPTINEAGIGKVEDSSFGAFVLPAKTPLEIAAKINADVNAIIKSGALDKSFGAAGLSPLTLDTAQADAFIAGEYQQWQGIAGGLKVRLD